MARKAFRKPRGAVVAPMSEPVVNGRRLSRGQRERLGEAERLAAGSWRDRQRAAAIVRAVERELAEAREAESTQAAIDAALDRARKRGEAFEVETVAVGEWRRDEDGALVRRKGELVFDVQTVRRASRVDGLVSLYRSGALDDRQKQTGDRFRQLWERAVPPMAVSDPTPKLGGAPDCARMLVQVALAGSAGAVVREIGVRLATRTGDGKAFEVLCAVAGRGLTLRAISSGGDVNTGNRQRLIDALGMVSEVLAEDRWKGLAQKER